MQTARHARALPGSSHSRPRLVSGRGCWVTGDAPHSVTNISGEPLSTHRRLELREKTSQVWGGRVHPCCQGSLLSLHTKKRRDFRCDLFNEFGQTHTCAITARPRSESVGLSHALVVQRPRNHRLWLNAPAHAPWREHDSAQKRMR